MFLSVFIAAHCIWPKNEPEEKLPENIGVEFGRLNLKISLEKDSAHRDVKKLILHEDYHASERKFDADIAILFLSKLVTFTNLIQPACLPTEGIQKYVNGKVVIFFKHCYV